MSAIFVPVNEDSLKLCICEILTFYGIYIVENNSILMNNCLSMMNANFVSSHLVELLVEGDDIVIINNFISKKYEN